MTTLTLSEARQIFLRNQRLIEPAKDPLEALRSIIAVQTQYAASLPVALHARSLGYPCEWHETALRNGSIVKSWTLRRTVHTQAAEDHALFLAALGSRLREQHLGWTVGAHGLAQDEWPEVERKIVEALSEGPLSRQELHARIPALARLPWAGWGQDVKGLAYLGALTFANNDGVTKFQACRLQKSPLTEEEAAIELTRRYFGSFGPASFQDFTYWSQMPLKLARGAFKSITEELTPIQIDGIKGARFVVAGYDRPIKGPSPTLLLPKFDALALAHRDKGLFFSHETAKRVFRPAGQIEALVLTQGEIVGTWRIKKSSARAEIAIETFKPIALGVQASIEGCAMRLAKTLGLREISVYIR